MKPSAIIREARNVIIEGGWTQHMCERDDGSHCLVGAIAKAEGRSNLAKLELIDERVALAVATAIPMRFSPNVDPADVCWYWNDEEGRTIHEVLDVLDRAEKVAERCEGRAR